MDVHIEVVRGADEIRALLKANGWRLAEGGPARLTARHPEVRDEETARSRLHQMGLLISSRLRIAFGPLAN
jgi:hypothetical protein